MRLRTVASESTMVKVVSSGEGFGDSTEGAKIVWGFNLFYIPISLIISTYMCGVEGVTE